MKLIFTTLLSGFLITACTCQKKSVHNNSSEARKTTQLVNNKTSKDTIYLKEGQNIFLENEQMNVTFKKVTEDSRCPTGINCVWEGAATLELELTGTYTRPQTLSLQTLDNEFRKLKRSGVFNSHRITVVDLKPYPSANSQSNENKGKYEVGITVEKINLHPRADKLTN